MYRRLILSGACLIALQGPALGHDVGFAEQVLQPITRLHSLLPLIAVGLLSGRQINPPNRVLTGMLGLGLTLGLATAVLLTRLHGQMIFPLALAAVAGGFVALDRPLAGYANFLLVLALGTAIGTNLSSETTDWVDLTQALVGAIVGATAVLLGLAALAGQFSNEWQRIGLRVVGSWIFASAVMVLALHARSLM